MGKALEVIHPFAAGIDIGSRSFFVDAGEKVEVFPTYTEGCYLLRDYLLNHQVNTVAMESTGVYWVILYSILEEAGIEVYLVNGRDVKNVPGRKSDVKDCQWLRQLHSYGLLRKSFIPTADIRELRFYLRLRQDHIRAQASQVHLMQKALTQMNVRLAEVISDVMGMSGKAMISAILEGERNPEVLVELCADRIKNTKREEVIKSLQGFYKQEHLFALKQAYQTWHYYQDMIHQCDKEMETLLSKMTDGMDQPQTKTKRKAIRYNRPLIEGLDDSLLKLTGGRDPIGIAGITDYSFLQIVGEVGTEMSHWENEKRFVSWLKLCPLRNSSGMVSKRVRVKRSNKASLLFRQIAQGLLTSKNLALGAFGRRIRAKRGSGVAIKAIARKIACFYYRVMTRGEAFVEQGIINYEAQQQDQKKRYLERMAWKLNMKLVEM
jgi:transposase